MNVLANKVAIITGASSGIGRATALLFAREGAAVVVAARRKAELENLVREITAHKGTAVCVAGDVRDETYAQTYCYAGRTCAVGSLPGFQRLFIHDRRGAAG